MLLDSIANYSSNNAVFEILFLAFAIIALVRWPKDVRRMRDSGDTVASCQQSDLRAMTHCEGIRYHDQATIWLACLSGNEEFELGHVVNGCDKRLHAEGRSGGLEGV